MNVTYRYCALRSLVGFLGYSEGEPACPMRACGLRARYEPDPSEPHDVSLLRGTRPPKDATICTPSAPRACAYFYLCFMYVSSCPTVLFGCLTRNRSSSTMGMAFALRVAACASSWAWRLPLRHGLRVGHLVGFVGAWATFNELAFFSDASKTTFLALSESRPRAYLPPL
jgi:hypothetical protein